MGDLFSKSHRHRADTQTRAIRKLNEKEMPLSARAQLATKYAIKPYNCGVAIKNESHKVLRNETRCDKNQIKLPTGKKSSGPTFVHSFPSCRQCSRANIWK